MRILTVVGARPNFVKVAPLLDQMGRYPEIEAILVHTGQHYDYEMSKAFFEDLEIPAPHLNLGVGSGTAVAQTAEIMLRLERMMEETQPRRGGGGRRRQFHLGSGPDRRKDGPAPRPCGSRIEEL